MWPGMKEHHQTRGNVFASATANLRVIANAVNTTPVGCPTRNLGITVRDVNYAGVVAYSNVKQTSTFETRMSRTLLQCWVFDVHSPVLTMAPAKLHQGVS